MTATTTIEAREAGRFAAEGSANELESSPGARFASNVVARHSRKSRGGRSESNLGSPTTQGLLSEEELKEADELYEAGITAVQIVEIFVSRGVRFSEATFRKYVQQGLLPRSRRIGRKGKHRGSLGVYPTKVVRRINLIKTLMQSGYTIDEIQSQFLQFTDVIEGVEEGLSEAFQLFQSDLSGPRFASDERASIGQEIRDAEEYAEELLAKIYQLSERLSQAHGDSYQSASAAGSAEDLL